MSESDGRRFEVKQQPGLNIEGEICMNSLGNKSLYFDAPEIK